VDQVSLSTKATTTSLWLDQEHSARPPLTENITTDIAIIGGGISGVSTALALAERGYSPVVLEQHHLASGASGRNAGFLIAGSVEYYHRAIGFIGHDKAKRFWQMSEENHTQLQRWISENDIHCDYQHKGSLVLAASASEFEEIQEAAAALQQDGFQAEVLKGEELNKLGLPPDRYLGGYFCPDDGAVNPVKLVRGLGKASEENSVRIFEQSPVIRFEESRSGTVKIFTKDGHVEAQILILATNAYTPLLKESLAGKIVPVRGQMLATEPVKSLVEVPCYANFGYDYFRQLSDGRLIIGGSRDEDPELELGYEEIPTDAIQSGLEEYLKSLLGDDDVPEITHRWAGIMGFARDGLPILGRIPSSRNIFITAGFTGHGMGIATKMAEITADLITEGKHPDFSLVSIRRFLT